MSDVYAENMSRNAREARRLDEQFDLITENMAYLVHPSVVDSLQSTMSVADIGTGTGVFLNRLQKLYPDATFDGFDISPALFPEPVPVNTKLGILDIKTPIPEEKWGMYDYVHVRLLAAAMRPHEWGPAVENISKLLRPGGWLQWEECDFSGVKHLAGREGSTVKTARRLGRAFRDGLLERFQHGWNSLPDDMRAAGLAPVIDDIFSSDRVPDTRERMTANGMNAIIAWIRSGAAKDILPDLQTTDMDEVERLAYKDIESGCYVRFDIHIACGQKPLA